MNRWHTLVSSRDGRLSSVAAQAQQSALLIAGRASALPRSALLQPLADALLTDPRTRLPAPAVDPAASAQRAAVCAPGRK